MNYTEKIEQDCIKCYLNKSPKRLLNCRPCLINKLARAYQKLDRIISQEKLMIEQAKKEAREELAKKIKEEDMGEYSFIAWNDLNDYIDKLLKEYEVI